MSEYKTCTKCKQTKLTSEFYKDFNTGGLRAACKSCVKKFNNDKRQANPESYRTQNLAYYYANKEQLNEYRRDKWPEIYNQTKSHRLAQQSQHRKENPHKVREFARKRRATKRANGWEKYTEAQVLDLHGAVCHICGDPIDLSLNRKIGTEGWEMSLHIDHVIPISKGGPDTLANVKPSHGKCNLKKKANLPNDETN
jgi:5-methylcytosine-specific restriction endonuclease McrA